MSSSFAGTTTRGSERAIESIALIWWAVWLAIAHRISASPFSGSLVSTSFSIARTVCLARFSMKTCGTTSQWFSCHAYQ